ncbi:GGDEF domain-containing protein, partial [Desulfobulbus sp. TB]|nr:GGDEF domain-containing protein [Desulfobulbus sp. TB]
KVHHRTQVLAYKANHDELTGLENRVSMFSQIQDALWEVQNRDARVAVFFIDLDKFKQLNDTFGHDVGDLILQETAIHLQEAVRTDDAVFRIGGDEFLILIKSIKDPSHVHTIAANILQSFKAPVMIQGQPLKIQMSIGIALSQDDTKNCHELVKFSDIAMFEAKHDKDTQYKIFEKSMVKRSSDIEQ